ncbi:hypothetical protein L873DRAFT_1693773 [Choiromyces venosus 120613-1]|uniref:RING-type domain-containing protein n=1 Tax=Choiromyces venosus 120613-1 TaxID=1336337 RepID=A0A3N4JIT0_9PEZI|nr:hypothetical protein L873DRAFT_1693773 [Choiromyces venosus 120613-1]
MSRVQQDTFIDDTEEFCPLCVEEFDIQDRNFRPCPCGYQICQFCYNNIKNNLNNLCPACRRPYDEKTIEWKVITAEEIRADQNKKNRQLSEKRKLEAQKREIDALNRKHLSGLRVIQKNLVYVTGLNPRIPEEDLLQTLRGKSYFGQYGKIIKIVDAEVCIDAVDGSQNGDRTLRATYGTTKYCSAYLRNEACPNRNCMFLHEPGEEADSYDRQQMSTFTVRQQEGAPSQALPPQHQSSVAAATPTHQVHPPPTQQQSAQMARVGSHQGGSSSMGDNGESSALPSTANWAKNPPTPAIRSVAPIIQPQGSAILSKGSTPSPRSVPAAPMIQTQSQESGKSGSSLGKAPASTGSGGSSGPGPVGKPPSGLVANNQTSEASSPSTQDPTAKTLRSPTKPSQPDLPIQVQEHLKRLENCVRAVSNPKFRFVFSTEGMTEEDIADLEKMPPMFDRHGGRRRRENAERLRAQQQQQQHEEAENDIPQPQPPVGTMAAAPGLVPLNMTGRGNTPSQRDLLKEVVPNHPQQQLLGTFQQQENLQHQQAMRVLTPGGILHPQQQQQQQQQPQQQQIQQSFSPFGAMGNPQQQQQQAHGGSLHTRQTSRYNFANDNPATASTSVNPRGNIAHMTEQLRMMPQQAQQQQQLHNQQQLAAQFYGAGGAPGLSGGMLGGTVQQPPPGLKSAPTPPAPGMGGIPMGGLHGLSGQFSGLGLGGHHNKSESSDALLRELMRGNGAGALGNPGLGGRAGDGKRMHVDSYWGGGSAKPNPVGDLADPSILQQPQQQMQHHQGGIQTSQQGSGVTAQERKLTPGMVDEDEFPALAPSTKENVVALPPIASTLKSKKPPPGPIGAKKKDETLEATKPEPTRSVQTKGKPVLPSVNTAAAANSSGPRAISPAIVTPSAVSYEGTTPISPAPPTAANIVKQGPRMIRILSSSSNMTSPAIKTPIGGGIGIGESDTASNGGSSRPVSPPPNYQQASKKLKTKSAMKKERIAAARKEAEEKERERERLERGTVTQAPVVGRMKKKGRKKGTTAGAGDSVAGGDYADEEKEEEKEAEASNTAVSEAVVTPVTVSLPSPVKESNTVTNIPSPTKARTPTPVPTPAPTSAAIPAHTPSSTPNAPTAPAVEQEENQQSSKTAAQLLAELQATTGIKFSELDMFKPLTTLKWEHYITSEEIQLIKAAVAENNTSQPILTVEPGCNPYQYPIRGGGLVNISLATTPTGFQMMGLSAAQQERYTRLEERQTRAKAWQKWTVESLDFDECDKEVGNGGDASVEELEKTVYASRKEAEGIEKKLEKLLKRNKKLVGLS